MKRTNQENALGFMHSALAILSQHCGSVALMHAFIQSIPYLKAQLLRTPGDIDLFDYIKSVGIKI